MCSLAMYSLAASVSRLRSSRQPFSTARTFASVRFVASERFKQSPVRFRSSVRSAMPLATARSGRAESSFDRFKIIWPLSAARAPKIVSTSSVRPAPARPATPTTSPARASKLTSENLPSNERPSTRNRVSPASTLRGGKISVSSRPAICRINSSVESSPHTPERTTLPSRRMVSRSAIDSSSSSRCEM